PLDQEALPQELRLRPHVPAGRPQADAHDSLHGSLFRFLTPSRFRVLVAGAEFLRRIGVSRQRARGWEPGRDGEDRWSRPARTSPGGPPAQRAPTILSSGTQAARPALR